MRDGGKMVLIWTCQPPHAASNCLEIGQRIPLQPSSSSRAFIAAATSDESERIVAEHLPDPDVLDELLSDRPQARADMALQGFVSTPAGNGTPAAYNAVSVPFRSGNLSEPVVFTCGALRSEASVACRETEVGPRLIPAVRTLERLTGQAPGLIRREA